MPIAAALTAVLLLAGCVADAPTSSRPGGVVALQLATGNPFFLSEAAEYWLRFEFTSRSTVEDRCSFPARTRLATITEAIAEVLRKDGLEVTAIPELGALRIGFVPDLAQFAGSGFSETSMTSINGDVRGLGYA